MFFNCNNVSVNSNTVKVNGRKINLPSHYNSLSVINGTVYVDGVIYDGSEEVTESKRKKDMKTIDFDETIISILADYANVNVEIVNDKKSSISYDNSEFDVNVSGGFIYIKRKVNNVTSHITINLSKKHLSSFLNLDIEDGGNIKFESQEELNTSLALTTVNGNIKVESNTTEDITLSCDNGNIKSNINCRETDIRVDNGNVKGSIRVKEDSTIRVDNGSVKICTLSKINDRVKNGSAKLNHRRIDDSTIYVSIDKRK